VAIVILAWSEADHQIAGHISEAESTLLATVLGAMVGAVATFLGMRNERRD
jgi:predicted membrane-bound mannosyltransferase